MSRFQVDGKVVDTVELLRRKPVAWRLDVWPFAIVYAAWIFIVIPSIEFGDAVIVVGGLLTIHVLVLLFTAWSIDFKCLVQFSKVSDIYSADACKVTPAKFSGAKEIVSLLSEKQFADPSSLNDAEAIFFDFRKQRFVYSKDSATFCKLLYPTKETFGQYLRTAGHGSEAKVAVATKKWGRNVIVLWYLPLRAYDTSEKLDTSF